MARPASKQPTQVELELLKILWDLGPTELGKICQALRRRRDVATTTVATMLKVMVEKGLARRARGPSGYRWAARISRERASTGMLRDVVARVFDGSAVHAVAHMLRDRTISNEDLAEIQRLIRERRRREPGAKSSQKRKEGRS